MNEDVNTYLIGGTRDDLFFTIPQVQLVQNQTQTNPGGLTDAYLESGTYLKLFYTVMMAPSCARVGVLKITSNYRMHHRID